MSPPLVKGLSKGLDRIRRRPRDQGIGAAVHEVPAHLAHSLGDGEAILPGLQNQKPSLNSGSSAPSPAPSSCLSSSTTASKRRSFRSSAATPRVPGTFDFKSILPMYSYKLDDAGAARSKPPSSTTQGVSDHRSESGSSAAPSSTFGNVADSASAGTACTLGTCSPLSSHFEDDIPSTGTQKGADGFQTAVTGPSSQATAGKAPQLEGLGYPNLALQPSSLPSAPFGLATPSASFSWAENNPDQEQIVKDEAMARQLQEHFTKEQHDATSGGYNKPPAREYSSDLEFMLDQEIALGLQWNEETEAFWPPDNDFGNYTSHYSFRSASPGFNQGEPMDLDPPSSSSQNTSYPNGTDRTDGVDERHIELFEDLSPLHEFSQSLSIQQSNCGGCGKLILTNTNDLVNLVRKWFNGSGGRLICGLHCSNKFCSVSTCPSCNKAIFTDDLAADALEITGTQFSLHRCRCDGWRLFLIWTLLCGWDTGVRNGHRTAPSGARASQPPKPSSPPAGTGRGVGYGGEVEAFVPNALHRRGKNPPAPVFVPNRRVDHKEDKLREGYFRVLAMLWPSHDKNSEFDQNPPRVLCLMLARSPLMVTIADLLSNDSIEDVGRQCSLYNGVLTFIDAVGNHTATASLVFKHRVIYSMSECSLLILSFLDRKGKAAVDAAAKHKDTGRSLASLLSTLDAQGKKMLQYAEVNQAEFSTRESRDLIQFCHNLHSISGFLNANQRADPGQGICTTQDLHVPVSLEEWHRENAVRDVSDDGILKNFHFSAEAQAAVGAQPAKGRMKRLITELATLQTSLPVGIFVRHGSSRLDVMKILIVGPKSTPYEYGFFEFDLFCPLDYPCSPPKMQFKTTNGGRIRFNPNLYEDGKVCLSLLGTWSGEPWRQEHSTLLQVLVSIQSMVLCEHPWYNEPGREASPNPAQSEKYNQDVRSWSLHFAILPWVEAISARAVEFNTVAGVDIYWADTAQAYLRANAKDIAQTAQSAVKGCQHNGLEKAAKEVAAALSRQGYVE